MAVAGWKRLGLARGMVRVGSEARASAESLGPAGYGEVRRSFWSASHDGDLDNIRTWQCHPTTQSDSIYSPRTRCGPPFVVASALIEIFVSPSYTSSNSLHLHLAGASILCWPHTKTRKPSDSPSAPASRWFSGRPRPCLVAQNRTVSVLLEGGKSDQKGRDWNSALNLRLICC